MLSYKLLPRSSPFKTVLNFNSCCLQNFSNSILFTKSLQNRRFLQVTSCTSYNSYGIGSLNRFYSSPSPSSTSSQSPPDPDDEVNQDPPVFSEEEQRRETRIRRYKKIFSSLLFAGTLVTVLLARRKKQHEREENFQDCVRLPIDESFKGNHNEFYRVGKDASLGRGGGCVLPVQMLRDGTLKAIQSFEVKPDDIFVASFPKTGTTWVQEIVYLLMSNFNFEKASEKVLETRFPYLEYPYPGLTSVVKQPSPRFIKTHLPLDLLPKDTLRAKVIYITRNPKDTVVSYYHFSRMLAFSSYTGTFEEFRDKFIKNEIPYTPFFGHLDSFLKEKGNPNLLIITYEDLTKNPADVIKKIADFLDKPLTDSQVELLVHHTSFAQMAKNPSVNYTHWDEFGIRNKDEAQFMRKGKVGDWRNYFTPKANQEFDEWIGENSKGFSFEYDL